MKYWEKKNQSIAIGSQTWSSTASQPARPRTTSVPSAATPPPRLGECRFLSGPGAVTQAR